MLMCTDSFREPEQWTRQVVGQQSTWTRTAVISMDAYRQREQFIVDFDLPEGDPASIDIGGHVVAERG